MMNNKTYSIFKLLYGGIIGVIENGKTNYQVGDIYNFQTNDDSIIQGEVIKSVYYENYDDGKSIIRIRLF